MENWKEVFEALGPAWKLLGVAFLLMISGGLGKTIDAYWKKRKRARLLKRMESDPYEDSRFKPPDNTHS
jgi:hypothetical protein